MKESDPLFKGMASRYIDLQLGMPLDIMVTVAIDSGHIIMLFTAMAFHLVCLDGVDDLGPANCVIAAGLLSTSGFHWSQSHLS